jgi:hypothetical protein
METDAAPLCAHSYTVDERGCAHLFTPLRLDLGFSADF